MRSLLRWSDNVSTFRTDANSNHINGQGNYGLCAPGCDSNILNDQRAKFSSSGADQDVVNLPDNSAVVFADEIEESIIVMPPN